MMLHCRRGRARASCRQIDINLDHVVHESIAVGGAGGACAEFLVST